jgi:parvulin-like peptidyl-prolyl isomerase
VRPGLRFTLSAAASAVLALAALAQVAPRAGAPAPPKKTAPAIATVGSRRVTRAEFDSRLAVALDQYRSRLGKEVPAEFVPIVRRQVLESLIRRELLTLEAPRRGIVVPEAEAEQELRHDPFFTERGVFNAAKFDAVKSGQPQAYQAAIQLIREQLGARRLNAQLERQFSPAESTLRARAARTLSRASVEYLALRRLDFSGIGREPREMEVLGYYRSHLEAFRRPDRANLSVMFFDAPRLEDSLAGNPPAVAAWNERMRQRADSALARVRAGVTFEEAVAPLGTPRRNVVVARDNFPGYWRGDARVNDLLFRQNPGSVIPEPIPGRPGWLLARVDAVEPSHVASLAEAAREIRARLRSEAREGTDLRELRAIYEAKRDSLRSTAYRVRYALADTGLMSPGAPRAADLEQYYRAHLADYSSYDPATASVKARPLAAVADDVRRGWYAERRSEGARLLIGRLERTWREGKRDRALEASATLMREVGPIPAGAPVDTGFVGRMLTDSLEQGGGAPRVAAGVTPRGPFVFQVFGAVQGYVPTFEQARPGLAKALAARRDQEDERHARELFDGNPRRFATGRVIHLTRALVPLPDVQKVPLTRKEVERYHREHIEDYSAPEEVTARHILISPTGPGAAADSAALEKARGILRRIRAGENFAALARQYSDDPATRDKGGDLGAFGRGAMLDEFERAAFSLKPDQISEPVKTEVGYHIIQCLGHEAAVAQPLAWMYGNVGADAALEKSKAVVKRRAESLYVALKSPAAIRKAAPSLGLQILPIEQIEGNRRAAPEMVSVLEQFDRLKPGELYPGVYEVPGLGWALSWVDSITAPRAPSWEDARPRAIAAWRLGAGQRSLDAKRAELDSMLAGGWTFDSLAVLWGGLQKVEELRPGQGLPGTGGTALADSLVFGGSRPAALRPGIVSDWIEMPQALTRVRLNARQEPDPSALAGRLETDRRASIERDLFAYFESLKKRYPVAILDPALRDVALPPPPSE